MLLAVDIGNTNIAFAVFSSEGSVKANFRLETRHNKSKDEYLSSLNACLSFNDLRIEDVKDVIVSSVVPQIHYEFNEFCKKYFSIKPIYVNDNIDLIGIRILLDKPEEVGSDRIVNAISAHQKYDDSNIIVVDFGTATTFDVIDSNGSYLGGMISPGVNLSINALQNAAAKLPEISISKPAKAIGKDTKSAMQAGIYFGYLGLIEKSISQIKQELNDNDATIIFTGGLASYFFSPDN